MDEYFALNAIFGGVVLFYFHKMYVLVGKMVSVIEMEFQNTPLLNTPKMEIPPPPPPIPDEWFEENQMWHRN